LLQFYETLGLLAKRFDYSWLSPRCRLVTNSRRRSSNNSPSTLVPAKFGGLLATTAAGKGAPLQIVSLDSLRTIRSLPTRDFDDFDRFAFSADSRSIFYVTKKGADATIWRQPPAAATPVKVASLPGLTVNWIRSSPDAKKLGLILEAPTSEAVLLHDVR
jgi:hypothetical protein